MTTFRSARSVVGAHRVSDDFGDAGSPIPPVAVGGNTSRRGLLPGQIDPAGRPWQRDNGYGQRAMADAVAGQDPAPRPRLVSDWPFLAGDFWWLIHSERTGLLQVDSVVAGLGLAGALLCELAVARQVLVVLDGRLQVAEAAEAGLLGRRDGLYGSPEDHEDESEVPEWAVTVLRLMLVEPQLLPVADWLAFLSRTAYACVAKRMVADGLVHVERAGRLMRRRAYPPVDVNVSGWAAARLRIHLERGETLSLAERVVVGLCLAAGVQRRVFDGVDPRLVATLGGVRDGLPEPLPQLLCQVETAVAAAVVHRP